MIRIFLLLLALTAGIWSVVNTLKEKGSGYVFVAYNHYEIETSMWFALCLMLVFYLFVFLLIKAVAYLYRLSQQVGIMTRFLGEKKQQRQQHSGKLAFVNHDWSSASKLLSQTAKKSDTPFVDFIMAGHAAMHMGDIKSAREALAAAKHCEGKVDEFSLLFLDYEISFASGDPRAKTVIDKLIRHYPADKALVEKAFATAIRYPGEPQQTLWAVARKVGLLDTEPADLQVRQCFEARCDYLLAQEDKQTLVSEWKPIAKTAQSSYLLAVYCSTLDKLGDTEEAIKLLSKSLKKHWQGEAGLLWVTLDQSLSLEGLESLKVVSQDAYYDLAKGICAFRAELYGKAKDYIEQSITKKPTVAAWQWLAKVQALQNDMQGVRSSLQHSLELVGNNVA